MSTDFILQPHPAFDALLAASNSYVPSNYADPNFTPTHANNL